MNKLKVVDFSDRLNAEGKYKLNVSGYTGYGKNKEHVDVDIDISDLTLDQIGVIGGFLNATFDDSNLSSITGCGIRRLNEDDVITNGRRMVEVFGIDTVNDFKYYLTHVLTNQIVTEKFYKWLDEPYVKGELMIDLRKFPVVDVNKMTLELQIDDHFKQYIIDKFEDELKGIHYIFKFPNDYGASVIKGKYTYGCERNLWEMGLIFFNEDSDWSLTYERDFYDDVKGYLTDSEVNEFLGKILKY